MNIGDSVWVERERYGARMGKVVELCSDRDALWVKYAGDGVPQLVGMDKIKNREPDVAVKHDTGKPMMSLIPHEALEEIAAAFTFGAQKYSAHNWRKGFNWLRISDSLLRHVVAWIGGEDKDPESGLSHLAHAGACVSILLAHEKSQLGVDDRHKQ